MASRFFAVDDDIEEEEEQEEEQEKEEPEETQTKVNPFFFESGASNAKRVVLSEKTKRFQNLSTILNNILDNLTLENWNQAFDCFQKLQKAANQSSKVFEEHGVPNFFIRQLVEINSLVIASSAKQLTRFTKELSVFVAPYEEKMKQCQANPDDFIDPEEELEENAEEEVNEGKNETISWFQSSDDEEANDIIIGKDSKPKGPRRKEMSAADAVAARLDAEKNKVIDDNIARLELEKFSESRLKGKIITTTSRVFELLNAAQDRELQRSLKLEICHMLAGSNSDEAIDVNDWQVVLTVLPELVDDAHHLIPMFNRLDKDFWAKSIDPQILFSPDTALLHSQYPKYIDILKLFSDVLMKKNEFALALHLNNLLINHLYTKPDIDIMELALSIMELSTNPKIMEAKEGLLVKVKAALYLCVNLSLRGHPEEGAEILKRIPYMPHQEQTNRLVLETMILYNRTIIYIGISAFEKGNYPLAAQILSNFEKPKKIDMFIGQFPTIYAPWQIFESSRIEIARNFSIMMADLPFLIGHCDESKLLIKLKYHKEIERKPVLFKPEDNFSRVISAIDKTKHGEWNSAWNLLKDDFKKYFNHEEKFLNDLKRMALCVYLQTAAETFDSVSTDVLMKKFEVPKPEVIAIIKEMKKGKTPIINACIDFNAELIENDNFVSFEAVEVKSPLVEFGNELNKKSHQLNIVIPKEIKGNTVKTL